MTKRVVSAALLASAILSAQEFRATISGRITDSQDAVIANVKVTAIQVDTGAKFEAVSGAEGLYTLPFLPPAAYRIIAEHPGFKRFQQEGVNAGTNERVALDIKLDVGQITETVSVTAEAPILQTATASAGQV